MSKSFTSVISIKDIEKTYVTLPKDVAHYFYASDLNSFICYISAEQIRSRVITSLNDITSLKKEFDIRDIYPDVLRFNLGFSDKIQVNIEPSIMLGELLTEVSMGIIDDIASSVSLQFLSQIHNELIKVKGKWQIVCDVKIIHASAVKIRLSIL